MRTKWLGAVLALALVDACAGADEAKQVTLVYPHSAADAVELDSSTPAKRALPPTREESEFDPVTPIGQVREILTSINGIQEKQDSIASDVAALKRRDNTVDLSGVFTKDDGAALKASIAEAKENERKSVVGDVKSLLNGAVNARSKLVDYCSLATFALVVLQTIILCGQTIAAFVRSRRDALEAEIAKRYLEKQQNSSNKSAGGIT